MPRRKVRDVESLSLSRQTRHLLEQIDGVSDEQELAFVTGLTLEQVTASIDQLVEFGAVALARGAPAAQPAAGEAATIADGAAAEYVTDDDPECDLDLETRREIDEALGQLGQLDFYELLEIEPDADKKQIRRAYYQLAPLFHPDKHFRKKLGSYKPKIEAVFAELTRAYETLRGRASREAYDAALPKDRRPKKLKKISRRRVRTLAETEPLPAERATAAGASVPPAPATGPTAPRLGVETSVGASGPLPSPPRTGFSSVRPRGPEPASPPPPLVTPASPTPSSQPAPTMPTAPPAAPSVGRVVKGPASMPPNGRPSVEGPAAGRRSVPPAGGPTSPSRPPPRGRIPTPAPTPRVSTPPPRARVPSDPKMRKLRGDALARKLRGAGGRPSVPPARGRAPGMPSVPPPQPGPAEDADAPREPYRPVDGVARSAAETLRARFEQLGDAVRERQLRAVATRAQMAFDRGDYVTSARLFWRAAQLAEDDTDYVRKAEQAELLAKRRE